MVKIPEDKWQCEACKTLYAIDEEDDDGEENQDYADQYYCDECDSDEENPYCGDCILFFEECSIFICSECLDAAMKDTET